MLSNAFHQRWYLAMMMSALSFWSGGEACEAFVASLNRSNWSATRKELECGGFQQFDAWKCNFPLPSQVLVSVAHQGCVFSTVPLQIHYLLLIAGGLWSLFTFRIVCFDYFRAWSGFVVKKSSETDSFQNFSSVIRDHLSGLVWNALHYYYRFNRMHQWVSGTIFSPVSRSQIIAAATRWRLIFGLYYYLCMPTNCVRLSFIRCHSSAFSDNEHPITKCISFDQVH